VTVPITFIVTLSDVQRLGRTRTLPPLCARSGRPVDLTRQRTDGSIGVDPRHHAGGGAVSKYLAISVVMTAARLA
jgi:hypothetical protein